MPIVNGINYNEKMITDEELAVVKAMRLGADVNVSFHRLKDLAQVDERMDLFAGIPKDGFSWIMEREDSDGNQYISFNKQMNDVEVTCYMDTKKSHSAGKQ